MNNLHRQRNKILTRDHAHDLLQSYYDDFVQCVQAGLNTFISFYPAELRKLSQQRTLANVLNDAVCDEAMRSFGGGQDGNVVVNEDHHGKLFVFFGSAAIRFKKVDSKLAPRNVRTGRQVKISYQQLELDGIERPTVLNLGYEPNILFTEIVAVSLSCRSNRHIVWEIPLAETVTAYLFDHKGNVPAIGAPVVRSKLVGKVIRNG